MPDGGAQECRLADLAQSIATCPATDPSALEFVTVPEFVLSLVAWACTAHNMIGNRSPKRITAAYPMINHDDQQRGYDLCFTAQSDTVVADTALYTLRSQGENRCTPLRFSGGYGVISHRTPEL